MNLYRSFGNLMEAWVTDGPPNSEWLERNNDDDDPPSPPSDADTNVRSESVDSGVETASSDISFPTPASSVSADMEAFTPESQDTPTSQSPVLSFPAPPSSSSSSPRLMAPRSEQNRPTFLPNKVEQALLRTESLMEKRNVTVDDVLKRRPQSFLLPKRPDLVRRERSGSYGLKKAASPSLSMRQVSDVKRRPQSAIYDRQPSETMAEVLGGGKTELSPGLLYLEQVCQMLEEYATQQIHNNYTLHNSYTPQSNTPPMEAVEEAQESQDEQAVGTCHTDPAEDEAAACQSFEKTQVSSVPQQRRERPYGHFRQRSASDTNLASMHLRRIRLEHREQHLSSHDLLETAEDDQENQECQQDGANKTKHFWRLKFGSLRREESTKSQQMQTFEKSSSRRRLSQLFRRRRKTGPL